MGSVEDNQLAAELAKTFFAVVHAMIVFAVVQPMLLVAVPMTLFAVLVALDNTLESYWELAGMLHNMEKRCSKEILAFPVADNIVAMGVVLPRIAGDM